MECKNLKLNLNLMKKTPNIDQVQTESDEKIVLDLSAKSRGYIQNQLFKQDRKFTEVFVWGVDKYGQLGIENQYGIQKQ